MRDRIIKFIIVCAVGYALYFVLAHHIIMFGRDFVVLKKEKLDLGHSFYSPGDRKEIMYKGLDNMLMNEDLRNAGLGELLVERGLISEEELEGALNKIDYGE
ncbi:Uncharacterized protein dnl_49330 [Desulfonema limicola]|uniref:Uncharacterized protein n=1 Tax=Desulfonema limicola TaxID=45656 RepID=A0A975GIL1_9BACT|nr:hypothetical protein [Desulfonema limicola]QTA82556.1 Uncharacterized protein dnl_49330 [Desulfonema limicola]